MSNHPSGPRLQWVDDATHRPHYFERDSQLLPIHQWPARLFELALARAGESHKLLRGTGLFAEDFTRGQRLLSPAQCYQLIDNCQRQLTAGNRAELGFLLGHGLLPGHQGELSNALVYARNLQEFVELLVIGRQQLSPLLSPFMEWRGDQLWLHWLDPLGAGDARTFLQEMMCAALASCSRWLGGRRFDWRFYFPGAAPRHIEEYQVHLGQQLVFNAPHCAMALPREQVFYAWPRALPQSATGHLHWAPAALPAGLLAEVYRYLRSHIALNPDLESCAAAFGMSSASLKRKLHKHASHFQAIYDQVRRDLALHWLATLQLTNEQLAQRLHFHDAANLRRAFKKWTGFTPSESRALLCH